MAPVHNDRGSGEAGRALGRAGGRDSGGTPRTGLARRTDSPSGLQALRVPLRDCLAKVVMRRQVAPGFYFQRCLPIWTNDLCGVLKEKKAMAVAAMDPNAPGAAVRVAGDPALYRALHGRLDHTFRTLRQSHDGIELTVRNLSPVVTGIGQPHPLENGFAFLKPYGVPYLAGSGVKGAVRAACTRAWNGEDGATSSAGCRDMLLHYFGSEDKNLSLGDRNKNARGALVFFDLLPDVESWEDVFRLDIVNPHYGPYYQGNAVPADWHSPRPSFFLTLRSGLSWHLRILYEPNDAARWRDTWASEIIPGLTAALTTEGLGAKKSWGYGLFAVEQMGSCGPVVLKAQSQAAAPSRKPQVEEAERLIRSLKTHEVKPQLQAVATAIGKCSAEEQDSLAELFRKHQEDLRLKPRDIRSAMESLAQRLKTAQRSEG